VPVGRYTVRFNGDWHDVGQTFTVDSTTTPNWSAVTAFLTDGINDRLAIIEGSMGIGAGDGDAESLFAKAGQGVDFKGYVVSNLSITLDSFSSRIVPEQGGFNFNNAGMTISVFGEAVPEPSTNGLLALGVLGLVLQALRRIRIWSCSREPY
jgi:hypothetical protein